MAFVNGVYLVYTIRKMKAHVKELDRLVTIRFDETEDWKAENSINKMERNMFRSSSIKKKQKQAITLSTPS